MTRVARVVRFHEVGGPEVLRIDDVRVAEPGSKEVRIAVEAFGLNRVESMFRSGGFGAPALPSKIGYEAAGKIEAIGSAVTQFAIGDRVATLPGLSMEQYGTYGELILYPADMLVRIPAEQSMSKAAAAWMQYLTAYAVVDVGNIKANDKVVITAASSSVGLAAIQIVNAAGGVPIAVTRGRGKAAALYEFGAAHVVVGDEENIAQKIKAITNDTGAELIFDAVGGAALGALLASLKPGGAAILYGALSGNDVAFPAHVAMQGGISIHGFAANQLLEDANRRRNAIGYIQRGLANGSLRPIIDKIFAFDDIAAAHRYLESNAQIGKIVVAIK